MNLVGDDFSQNFTFFAPNPNSTIGSEIINQIGTIFAADELQNVESEAGLRQTLEQFPSCVANENGEPSAEPLNVVIIGTIDNWTTAFIRRGYHYRLLTPRYAFGRNQDISGKKPSRGYTKAQSHTNPDLADTDPASGPADLGGSSQQPPGGNVSQIRQSQRSPCLWTHTWKTPETTSPRTWPTHRR
ncbi:MAG: hypothetical protein PVG01_08675 [Desulfobacterales bacterium]|jgi:hypothetical protein